MMSCFLTPVGKEKFVAFLSLSARSAMAFLSTLGGQEKLLALVRSGMV